MQIDVNQHENKEFMIFMDYSPIFPPVHYPFIINGYPNQPIRHRSCSKFYLRWRNNIYKYINNMDIPDELKKTKKDL